jgi:hypothetical protein
VPGAGAELPGRRPDASLTDPVEADGLTSELGRVRHADSLLDAQGVHVQGLNESGATPGAAGRSIDLWAIAVSTRIRRRGAG